MAAHADLRRSPATDDGFREAVGTCEAARRDVSPAERTEVARDYELLRRQHIENSRRARGLCADSRMRWTALRQFAQPLVQFGRLAHDLFTEFDRGEIRLAAPAAVEKVVSRYESRMRALEAQFSLLDRLSSYAEELSEMIRPLMFDGVAAATPFEGLARRISLDVRESAEGRLEAPAAGIPIAELLSGSGRRPEISCLATGLLAARLAAWTCPQYASWADETETLTIAALLQDIGLYFWADVRNVAPLELRRQSLEASFQHPRVGAALVGGIADLSPRVAELIAQHHERVNGTGTPRGLNRWGLFPLARLHGAMIRWTEFCHGDVLDEPRKRGAEKAHIGDSAGELATSHESAAAKLLDEAERGAWDVRCVRGVLQSLDLLPPARPLDDPEMIELPAMSSFGLRRLRRDAAHSQIRGPHSSGPASTRTPAAAMGVPNEAESPIPSPHFNRRTVDANPDHARTDVVGSRER